MALRNSQVTTPKNGRVRNAASASRGLMNSMAPRITTTWNESPSSDTKPWEMNWRIASTSLVTLVSVAPTAVRFEVVVAQAKHLAEQVHAQVVEQALAEVLHGVGERHLAAELADQGGAQQQRRARQSGQVASRDVAVDAHLGQVGHQRLQQVGDHHQQRRGRQQQRVRAHVA